jgi:prepilin-type N-terminal cleavage/methylation domain-containing protein
MQTSTVKTSNILRSDQGFSLIEILVALALAVMVFLLIPSGDSTHKHRQLKSAIDDFDRAARFAANEAVLRNTVVRLRVSMDKQKVEYTVEYGPAGNLPLPDMPERTNLSLSEEKALLDKATALDRQFNKVPEFEDIKHEIHELVEVIGIASTSQKQLMQQGEASIYFYPTGDKDGALIFLATDEELAYLEIEPFLADTSNSFESLNIGERVAKVEDIIQARVNEVYREWISR